MPSLLKLLALLVALEASTGWAFQLPATAVLTDGLEAKTASGALPAFDDDEHTYFVGESGAWVHNTCRVPALFDNVALVEAFENGNVHALGALRRFDPYITHNQFNEFIKGGVSGVAARRDFLARKGVKIIDDEAARTIAQSGIFKDVFSRVAKHHGRADAALLAFGRALEITVVTGERGIAKLNSQTLPRYLRLDVLKFPIVR